MKTQKIALIGGPGTGKTTLIDALKTKGYGCMEEISRQIKIRDLSGLIIIDFIFKCKILLF